jgi:hypothetical protein
MLDVAVMTEATFMADMSNMFDFSASVNVPLMLYVAFMFVIMFVNDNFMSDDQLDEKC